MSREGTDRRNPIPSEREFLLENLYLDALLQLGRQGAELCPQEGRAAQEILLRLRRRLTYRSEAQDLEDAHDAVHATLRDFGRRSRERLDAARTEHQALLEAANRLADLYAARDRAYLERLRELARALQDAAAGAQSPRHYAQIAMALTQVAENFEDDQVISQMRIRKELGEFEERRKQAAESAVVDPLTGFLTRAEAELRMRDSLALGRQFCILKLGLHEFSGLTDRYGTELEDQLRKSAADKLCDQVRPRDLIAQWDSHNFLLLFFDCPLAVAERRAEDISAWLSGDYRLYSGAQVLHADVQVTAAATEARPDEHPDEFVARAEALSPVLLTYSRR